MVSTKMARVLEVIAAATWAVSLPSTKMARMFSRPRTLRKKETLPPKMPLAVRISSPGLSRPSAVAAMAAMPLDVASAPIPSLGGGKAAL
jgi:hypothetical protein